MIAGAVARHVLEDKRRFRRPPSDFDTFRRMVSQAIEVASCSRTLAEAFEDEDSLVFTPMWDAWTAINAELKECRHSSESADLWREVVDFYVHPLIESVMLARGLRGDVTPLSQSVGRLLKDIVD